MYTLAPRRRRLIVHGRRILRTMEALSDWRTYGITFGPTVVGWLAECAGLYFVLQQVGAEVGFVNAVFVFSFSMIVGAVSMLPGGLGSTEATMVILLKILGVDLYAALAATAIIRLVTFWFAVVIGVLLVPVAMRVRMRFARSVPARTMRRS